MNEGTLRRIVADGESIMIVEIQFKPGGGVPLHHHPHEQVSTVVAGELDFVLGSQHIKLNAGDTLVIPSNVPHAAFTTVEGTIARDTFSPPREDFRG